MNWAVIIDGVVVNTIVWDGETYWVPPEGAMLVQIEDGVVAGIGWTYANREFTPPENPPPSRHP